MILLSCMSDTIDIPDFKFEVGDYIIYDDVSNGEILEIFYCYDDIAKSDGWHYRLISKDYGEFVMPVSEVHDNYELANKGNSE